MAKLVCLGRMQEAHEEAQKFLKDHPNFSTSYWPSAQPFPYEGSRYHAIEGFIKGGLPR